MEPSRSDDELLARFIYVARPQDAAGFVTYALAMVLLISVGYSLWVTLVFPVWVFVISVIFLITEKRS